MTENKKHIPVMLNEVLESLSVTDNERYVDCTFGLGGYSKAILTSADCFLDAIDRDTHAFEFANALKKEFPLKFNFHHAKFSQLAELDIQKVDGVVFDVGVSSPQLDNSDRGFSFSKEGRLNMGMGLNNLTAYDIVNGFDEEDIANIIYEFGEEPFSRRIAKAIVFKRKLKKIETTKELANIVHESVRQKGKTDCATKTFQAIRIYVNNELEELNTALKSAFHMLKPNGRLVVVSFHSLEDRIVKNYFNKLSGKDISVSRHIPFVPEKSHLKLVTDITLIKPNACEIDKNPRSRSAKLRYLRKV